MVLLVLKEFKSVVGIPLAFFVLLLLSGVSFSCWHSIGEENWAKERK
jgi:hypothetical protein